MNKIFFVFIALLLGSSAQAAILDSSVCKLASASPGAPDWQSMAFPLIKTNDGFEAARFSGSTDIFELALVNPSDLQGWPDYGAPYYRGGNDLWVILVPKDDSAFSYRVIKPLETDPNTGKSPAAYNCMAAN